MPHFLSFDSHIVSLHGCVGVIVMDENDRKANMNKRKRNWTLFTVGLMVGGLIVAIHGLVRYEQDQVAQRTVEQTNVVVDPTVITTGTNGMVQVSGEGFKVSFEQ